MYKKAFTLIEVIVVVVILAALSGLALSYTSSSIGQADFDATVNEIKESMLKMQTLSRNNFNNQTSGIHFETNQYTEFTSDTYSSADTGNFVVELPTTISLDSIDFEGNSTLYFSKYAGLPSNIGSVVVNSDAGESKTISINSNGIIEIN